MIAILLVTQNKVGFSDLMTVLDENGAKIHWAKLGCDALSLAAENDFDLVAIDEQLMDMSGLELAQKLVSTHPMINCAVVSSLSAKAYHEASEGLGLLMPLPVKMNKKTARKLLEHLNKIINLTHTKTD